MTLPQHITDRRSVFPQFFTGRPVPREVLDILMEAANQAPSHRKTEPWRFVAYRDAGKAKLLGAIREAYDGRNGTGSWDDKLEKKFSKKLQQSPVVLTIFLRRDPAASVPEWEEVAAVACAVQNIWTSLATFELGGYWSSPGFLCGDYGEFPGASADERCLGLFYIGYHEAPDLPRPRGDAKAKFQVVG